MARGRIISKTWSTSKKRAAVYRSAGSLAEFCLQLFPMLVVHSDDYGRLDGDAETVKLVCDPAAPRSVDDFDAAMTIMEQVGLIQRYQVGSTTWLQIVKFDEHQPGMLSKRSEPKSPAPPQHTELPEIPEFPESSVLTKQNGTKPKKSVSPEPPGDSGPTLLPPSPTNGREQAVLVYPIVGGTSRTWPLEAAQVAAWQQLYPSLNVLAECRKALAWVEAKERNRKTAGGMKAFLVGWLNRSNDSGGGRRAQEEPAATYRPKGCRHNPPCSSDAAHTTKYLEETDR